MDRIGAPVGVPRARPRPEWRVEGWEVLAWRLPAAGRRNDKARGLHLVSMAVFLVAISIGIVNGRDLYSFPHDVVLSHDHSGTLGWITLGIVGTAAWFFGTLDVRLAIAIAALIAVRVVGFLFGHCRLRARTGAAERGCIRSCGAPYTGRA